MEEAKTDGAKSGTQTKSAVVKCFVPTCDSKMGSVSRRNNVTFYNFPKRQSLYARWKRAVQGAEPPGDGSKVCSLHFKEEDFKCQALLNSWQCNAIAIRPGKLRVFLLNDKAVPSLRLPAAQLRSPPRLTRSQARLATGATTDPAVATGAKEDLGEAESSEPAVSEIKVEDSGEGSVAEGSGLADLYEAVALKAEDKDPSDVPPPKKSNARTCDRAVEPPARARRPRRNHHFSSNKLKNRLRRAERSGRRSHAAPSTGEDITNNKKMTYLEKIRDFRESLVGGRRSFRVIRGGDHTRPPLEPRASNPLPGDPPRNSVLKQPPPENNPHLKEPPKRFVALKMDVTPTPSLTQPPPPTKPFVALKMGMSPSQANHCIQLPPRNSFVVCSSDTRARLTKGVNHQVHVMNGQACCVPGCTTSQHQSGGGTGHPVFSFPTDPRWKARWNKSIFGDDDKTRGSSVSPGRTVATDSDGSKVYVHRRRIKMPMAAYRALFSIPGWGRSKGPAGTGDATLVIDERRVGGGASMVCSAHFLDGKPTARNPIPRLNLRPNTQELEGAEVRPEVHADHTYAVDMSPGLPTPPKHPADVLPESPAPRVQPPPSGLPTPPADTPGDDAVARRKGRSKTDRCPTRRRSTEHHDHTYAIISELGDFDKGDHTYAFIISEVKNTDATIWGQYSVSPLAQACYTTEAETFTEDQDLFYATVKQEVEDDFDTSPLVGDRCFSSDWEPAIKQEPADRDVDVPAVDRVKTEPPSEPECGSFHFVDVSNFMNDYRADFEDLGSLDSLYPAK